MISFCNLPPVSLGLGGDGDEIAAIAEVEREFGIQLDCSGALHWTTVGDVFEALKRALAAEEPNTSGIWPAFTRAISKETGVDATRVTAKTLLLGRSKFDWRIALAVGGLGGLMFVVMRFS